MIDIKDLTVKYTAKGKEFTAIENFQLYIPKGDIYVLIGPSGCGKSTLLHVLSGIITDFEGEIVINKENMSTKNQRIGLVSQNYGLMPWKTVYDNATLGLKIKDRNFRNKSKYDLEYIEYILERLKINTLVNRYPSELSGGQKQRVAIARAFILKPNLLLMDEPFSALDAITREEIQELFLDIWKENKVSTIFVTHSVDEAIFLGKNIGIFSSSPGKIIKSIHNPLFGKENLRYNKSFYDMSFNLRKVLKEEW